MALARDAPSVRASAVPAEEKIMTAPPHRTVVMASTSAKPTHPSAGHPKGRSISELGMTHTEARELRARLASFAREWEDPRMDVYDDQP
jgi:hypothetical protein